LEPSSLPVVVAERDKRHANSFCVGVVWQTQSIQQMNLFNSNKEDDLSSNKEDDPSHLKFPVFMGIWFFQNLCCWSLQMLNTRGFFRIKF